MAKNALKNVAYEYLLNAIMSYELKPGQVIVEQEVSDQLGISRTPIREAFKQLESEGLVHHFPSRGTFVTNLTVQDVEAALGMTVKAVESGGKDFLDAALNLDYHTERNNENFVYIKAYDREDE